MSANVNPTTSPFIPVPRFYAQKNFFYFMGSAAIAIASGVCHDRFLINNRSILVKLLAIPFAVFATLAVYFLKTTCDFYISYQDLVVPALDISVDKYPEAFEEAFARAKRDYKTDLLGITDGKVRTDQEKRNIFTGVMFFGTCGGQASVVLARAKEIPDASALELLSHCQTKVAEIFYLQMVDFMRPYFINAKQCWDATPQCVQDAPEVSGLIEAEIQRMDALHPLAALRKSPAFSSSDPLAVYKAQMDQFYQLNNPGQTFQGRVLLKISANLKGIPFGHSLFIQCAQGRYRYYEPSRGFYEFSTQYLFLHSLRSFLNEVQFLEHPILTQEGDHGILCFTE